MGQVASPVHQDSVRGRCVQQSRGLCRDDPHGVREQAERRQDLHGGFHRLGEQQQAH
jgi:hypothetical protein